MKYSSTKERLWLLILLLAATWLYLWGLQRNLPYIPEADENIFVERAIIMASTGNPNPGWFGNPGSTLFYPLLAIYRLWYVAYGAPAPDLAQWFTTTPWPFYFLARLLSVAYTLLTIPLTYQIGRRVFNPTTGLIGAAFLVSYPNVLFHIKSVRTDGVGMFFALLAVWGCLQVYQRPTLARHLGAGISVGLGIASRYFLVLFTPLLIWLSWRAWRRQGMAPTHPQFTALAAGLLAIGVSFVLSTPYFVLDFPNAWQNLVTEGRSTHPGADGLSRLQNFFWYFSQIARSEYQLLQSGFAAVGLLVIASQRRLLPLSLVGTIVLFLAGIAISPLHWLRWALPILPLAALVSADGLVSTVQWLTEHKAAWRQQALLVGLTLAAVSSPGLRSVQLSIQDANPTTRLAARLWLLDHLPTDARLIQEPYTALLLDDPRVVTTGISLGTEHTLEDYRHTGYTHLVISSYMYDRFLVEPARHPDEVAFYQPLLEETAPLVTFTPTWFRGGPTLQIYAISPVNTDQ